MKTLYIFIASYEIYTSHWSLGSSCCVAWASTTFVAAWFRQNGLNVPFSSIGVHSLCGHSYMVCAFCLANSYATVFTNNRRFNCGPQFQDK